MPEGFLPVFSVDTEDEARRLLTMACQTNVDGEFYSGELARSQDLDTLQEFSDKLARYYDLMKR